MQGQSSSFPGTVTDIESSTGRFARCLDREVGDPGPRHQVHEIYEEKNTHKNNRAHKKQVDEESSAIEARRVLL